MKEGDRDHDSEIYGFGALVRPVPLKLFFTRKKPAEVDEGEEASGGRADCSSFQI